MRYGLMGGKEREANTSLKQPPYNCSSRGSPDCRRLPRSQLSFPFPSYPKKPLPPPRKSDMYCVDLPVVFRTDGILVDETWVDLDQTPVEIPFPYGNPRPFPPPFIVDPVMTDHRDKRNLSTLVLLQTKAWL